MAGTHAGWVLCLDFAVRLGCAATHPWAHGEAGWRPCCHSSNDHEQLRWQILRAQLRTRLLVRRNRATAKWKESEPGLRRCAAWASGIEMQAGGGSKGPYRICDLLAARHRVVVWSWHHAERTKLQSDRGE